VWIWKANALNKGQFDYKGVKRRTVATISGDIPKNLLIMEKINMKYLGMLEHPLAKMLGKYQKWDRG
jgi:hypothetical protein